MASKDILSNLSGTLIEFSKRFFEAAIIKDAPLARGDVLKIEDYEGEDYTFMTADRATAATKLVLDGGLRPRAVALTPAKGSATPATVTTTLSLGRLAKLAKMSTGSMGSLLEFKLKAAASDCASTLERALHGWAVNPQAAATWSGTGANETVTVSFEDVTGFEPNMLVDFEDDSANLSYVVRVTGVTSSAVGSFSSNVAGTVDFKNDVVDPSTGSVTSLGATAVATGDTFRPAGYAAGHGGADTKVTELISFNDICGSGATSTLHGITTTEVASWVGHRNNLAAAYTQEASLAFMHFLQQKSGIYPDIAICPPQIAAAHAAAAGIQGAGFGLLAAPAVSSAVVRDMKGGMDKYGNLGSAKMNMNGAELIVSPLAPATKVRLCNSEHTKLIRWTEIEPEMDGNKPYHVDHDNVGILVFMSGDMQLVTERRNSVGEIYGITSL